MSPLCDPRFWVKTWCSWFYLEIMRFISVCSASKQHDIPWLLFIVMYFYINLISKYVFLCFSFFLCVKKICRSTGIVCFSSESPRGRTWGKTTWCLASQPPSWKRTRRSRSWVECLRSDLENFLSKVTLTWLRNETEPSGLHYNWGHQLFIDDSPRTLILNIHVWLPDDLMLEDLWCFDVWCCHIPFGIAGTVSKLFSFYFDLFGVCYTERKGFESIGQDSVFYRHRIDVYSK